MFQETREQLEKENKRLYEAMKSAASQNAQLIAKYEQELEVRRVLFSLHSYLIVKKRIVAF